MTFSMSLLSVFNSIISLNVFEESYETLLGLEIIMEDDVLKYDGITNKLLTGCDT